MRLYSTCLVCQTKLHITTDWYLPAVHPLCEDEYWARPNKYGRTYLDSLLDKFMDALNRGDEEAADQLAPIISDIEDQQANRPPALGLAARVYASWGWPVFPLQPGSKDPFPRSHGFKDATTSLSQIETWWTKEPLANIGLATGVKFDVVDIDPEGEAMWHTMGGHDLSRWDLDVHGLVMTSRFGYHAYVLPSGDGNSTNIGGLTGIDYRGLGGYVIAPPSVRKGEISGCWKWLSKPSPELIGDARG